MQAAVPISAERGVLDVRPLKRYLAAVVLVVAPLLVGALRLLIPYPPTQDTTHLIDAVGAHLAAQTFVVTVGPLCALGMVFASLSLARLVAPKAPVLAAIGGAVSLIGWVMLPALTTSDILLLELATRHPAGGAAIFDAFSNNPHLGPMVGLFIVGHIVGTVLLGAAMLRARLTPVWAGLVVIVGTLLHPIGLLLLHMPLVDGGSYVLVSIGFGAAALAIVRSPNPQWDVAPQVRSGHGAS